MITYTNVVNITISGLLEGDVTFRIINVLCRVLQPIQRINEIDLVRCLFDHAAAIRMLPTKHFNLAILNAVAN